MKCCKCNEEVDIRPEAEENQYPPARWFGRYIDGELDRIICVTCIKKEGNKDWHK